MSYIGKAPGEHFTSFQTETFSVSATTSYTLSYAVANENELALFINNVRQQPGSGKAYTASGTALTLSAATASTDTMYAIYLGRALQTITPSTNSITSGMLGSAFFTGATDVGAAIADADLFLMDDGAGGTLRKTAASRIKTYVGGGLSVADQWRLTSNYTIANSSTTAITANLERVDTTGQGVISAMTESSGIFTFPSTGYYLVTADFSYSLDEDSEWIEGAIQVTTDNSSYADISSQNTFIQETQNNATYATLHTNSLVDVTDTSNVKVRFGVARVRNSPLLLSNTNSNATYFTFLRLGDT